MYIKIDDFSNGAKLRQLLLKFNNVGDYSLHHPGTSRFQWSKIKATLNDVSDCSLLGTSRFTFHVL